MSSPLGLGDAPATVVDGDEVRFVLPDPNGRLAAVRLYQEVRIAGELLHFRFGDGLWRLTVDRPSVNRMEYLFELTLPNGARETVLDPGNPRRVPGAFGDKSVLEFPEYRLPAWLDAAETGATTELVTVPSTFLGESLHALVWSPDGLDAGAAAPLVLVHDGPEYAALGGLVRYCGTRIAAGVIPPVRLALLDPGRRNDWYAAEARYTRALATEVLAALEGRAPATVRIGVGASLGGLAMLHLHRLFPSLLDGLFLQSGSFFTPRLDPQEQRFPRFEPIVRFVATLAGATTDARPVPTVLTCGRLEENLANNRQMAGTLAALGCPVQLVEVADVHNYTAWRDALDPHLGRLIRRVAR